MEWNKFRNSWDNVISSSKSLAVATAALAVANIFLTLSLVSKTGNQKVIVIPPNINKEFWVSGNKLSTSYLEMVGNFIADKYLSISPETAAYQHSLLFPFVAPSSLASFKKSLLELESFVKREGISQVFYPKSFSVRDNEIVISGILKRFVGTSQIQSKKVKVLIKFVVRNGQFQLTAIEVKDA